MKNISAVIAKKLRSYRDQTGITLDRLSEITDVSKSLLSQIERGDSNPSINTLYKISTSLGISLSTLITEELEQSVVVRCKELTPVGDSRSGFTIYPLFPVTETRRFEIFYGELLPGGTRNAQPHQAGVQEFLTVTGGSILVAVNGKEHLLQKGDAIGFHADIPHTYRNPGSETANFCNTIFYCGSAKAPISEPSMIGESF